MLWEVDIYPAAGEPDVTGQQLSAAAAEMGLADNLAVSAARGYLIEGDLNHAQVSDLARRLLADTVVERAVVARVGDAALTQPPNGRQRLVHVLPKPGVMDPVAQSALAAIKDCGLNVAAVRTLRKYWFGELPASTLERIGQKLLANDAIEQLIWGPLPFDRLEMGSPYTFRKVTVELRELSDEQLLKLSREGQLSLSLAEMQTIQNHFRQLRRDPTDVELETLAQTWSEHCSHKTLKGRIRYRDESGERQFENMLKETIFAATQEVRRQAGADDWCVSVFEDNAGIVRFDDQQHVVFKVETHNHPSAIEPYGGSNTGIGGVIRDSLGTGLGAKPICSTDIFCFAPPDASPDALPPGVLHPKRVMRGVVAGVRDYGNRMGIPTVNGALYFDMRYAGNPLVFCGNVGLLPCDKWRKQSQPDDWVVVIGGRTGRDGIHGATFSSVELTTESESVSGGAVQIGNAITEKTVVDAVLTARDRGLFTAVTDCGAGGLSSAVGEMGAELGAEVWLERVPLKYQGLSYTEIWISEAQERMVLSVPKGKWDELDALCKSEGVEATVIGRFTNTGRLNLTYDGNQVADLEMEFLHDGRPPVVRDATYTPRVATAKQPLPLPANTDYTDLLLRILGSPNVASKEWVIRQYDHEVQGASVVKPLVGVAHDGPSDAAVLRPVLTSRRGIVVACGMNPHYGDLDTYHMAASAIDEAVRNCVAVGADPARIAILDNFCWGGTERPETLGSLVRAALACKDVAIELGTPFISGKDSLNNEYHHGSDGSRRSISIPPSLLISALGQIDTVDRAVTMDLKQSGNLLYQVGLTRNELGGSHFALLNHWDAGNVPQVHPAAAKKLFAALHRAIHAELVRSCHDLSEGGLAVAAAEMAFAGGLGARISLEKVPHDLKDEDAKAVSGEIDAILLFSESNTRFLCEVSPADREAFEAALQGIPFGRIGEVTPSDRLEMVGASDGDAASKLLISAELSKLKEAWQAPFRW